jgi:hypothetical protein
MVDWGKLECWRYRVVQRDKVEDWRYRAVEGEEEEDRVVDRVWERIWTYSTVVNYNR